MKQLPITLMLVFFTLISCGQTGTFVGGVSAGFNSMEVNGKQNKRLSSAGVTAGLFVQRFIGDRVPLQLDLRYIQKGGIHPYYDYQGYLSWESLRLHYVELPLTAAYRFGTGPRFFFLEGGMAMAYLFGITEQPSWEQHFPEPPDLDIYNRIDLSILGGMGYRIFMGTPKDLAFLLRFSHSLLTVSKLFEHYNMVFSFTACYYFHFASK